VLISPRRGRWDAYQFPPSFVLGFHGCDRSVGEAILSGAAVHLLPSQNDYDWLGSGIYFWEGNPQRALDFAQERMQGGANSQGDIREPFVLGAILNLGRCLDLRDSSALSEVKSSYEAFILSAINTGFVPPQNTGMGLKLRRLDCAVMNFLHDQRAKEGWPAYDTIRADFWEGEELYPGAGFRQQDHIQICVRDTASVLGYFRPMAEQS